MPVASDGMIPTNPAPKQGSGGACAVEGMCSWEDRTRLRPWLMEEQRARHSQGGPGVTWGLEWGFSSVCCCLIGIFSV